MLKTYNELKAIVDPVLNYFKDDLYEIDKKNLSGYDGKFIYGYRFSGTNLIMLDTKSVDYSKENKKLEFARLFFENNDCFLYFDGEKLIDVSKTDALKLLSNFISDVYERNKFIKKLNINAIALELVNLMKSRDWKSQIGSSEKSEIRRLRNHFNFMKLKKTSSIEDIKNQLYKVVF